MVQESVQSKDKRENISSLVHRRKMKKELLSDGWSKSIIKDVSIYDDLNDDNKDSKHVVITISSYDETYSEKYIINPYNTEFNTSDSIKIFNMLHQNIGKIISIGGENRDDYNVIRIDKAIDSSKYKRVFDERLQVDLGKDIIPTSAAIFCMITSIPFMYLFNDLSLFSLWFILDIYLTVVVAISFILVYNINKNWYKITQPQILENMDELKDISNDVIEYDVENNSESKYVNSFSFDNATVQTYSNGEFVIKNSVATWSFQPEDGIMSNDAFEFYKSYGGEFDDGDRIRIQVSPYDNDKSLREKQYISDCENWVLQAEYT
jgi:hypothetical protein